ncbi:YfmQ family protein [Bacillus sp. T3]|uniref:YfmQ family protein n=1 Tax=Bacillus sp. T3 TaxID=467262 RepID=UPI0039919E5E
MYSFFQPSNFIEKYYIWPGSEQSYLNPGKGGNPIVETKRGKKEIRLTESSTMTK